MSIPVNFASRRGKANFVSFMVQSESVWEEETCGLMSCVGWCSHTPVEWLLGRAPCVEKLLLVKLEVIIGQYLAMFEGTEKAERQKNFFPCLCQAKNVGQYRQPGL